MLHVSAGGHRPTMRAVGRLALPALSHGRAAAASAAASNQGARHVSVAAAVTEGQARERDPVQTLLASVQYELKRDCCNFQGEQQAFDQYLAAAAPQVPLPDSLRQRAPEYGRMPPWERLDYLRSVEQELSKLAVQGRPQSTAQPPRAVPAAAPPPAAPPPGRAPVSRYSTNRGRLARASISMPLPAQRSTPPPPQRPQQHGAPPPPAQQHEPAGWPPAGSSNGVWQHAAAASPSGAGSAAAAGGNGRTARAAAARQRAAAPAEAAAAAAARPPAQSAAAAATAQAPEATPEQAPSVPAADQAELLRRLVQVELGLSLEQQRQQPFEPPDAAALRRPIPIIFDLESTGLARDAFVTEIAALHVSFGGGSRGWSSLVQLPKGMQVPKDTQRLTGIDDAMLAAEGVPFTAAYEQFLGLLRQELEGAEPGAYLLLIGHNIKSFDLNLLQRQAQDSQLPLLRHARFLDTVELARKLPTGRISTNGNSLDTLHRLFTGSAHNGAHRAMGDCQATEVVLRGLLAHMFPDGMPGGSLEGALHAAAMQPDATWAGWVQPPKAKLLPQKAAPQFDLQSKLSQSTDSDDEVATLTRDLTAADPLADADRLVSPQARQEQVVALQAGWAAVQADAALRCSYLDTPIASLKKPFTKKEKTALEEAGVLTLGQLLECFPSRVLSGTTPGMLPQDGSLDDRTLFTLAVRVTSAPVVRAAKAGGHFLTIEFSAVHPSEAGLYVPGLPLDAYQGTPCKLKLYDFRNGGPWVLNRTKQDLEAAGCYKGATVVVSCALRSREASGMWNIDAKRFSVLPPEDAAAAFSSDGQGGPFMVVHPSKGGITPERLSALVHKGLQLAEEAEAGGLLQDPLPAELLQVDEEGPPLPGLLPALRAMHSPANEEEREAARQRLAFQELLALQLKLLVQRNMAWAGAGAGGVAVDSGNRLLALARASLPFELTGGQEAALEELLGQMAGWPPMQCLLQGDVGCGKTVVALLALLAASGSGYQGALMAPTEILAEQHFRSLQRLVQDMTREAGRRGETGFRQPRITLVTGSVTGKARRQINEQLENGEIDIAVGTHALISDSTQFKRLGLAVVDEQHKFGVEQRGRLLAKASPAPHVLHMTATPIPRTQALIDHGDMSLVLIQELPAGRSPVQTRALRDDRPEEREQMYAHMREEMDKGHGVYIVCPFVEQSDKMEEVKAATQELERLIEEGVFQRDDCGLLHGQMAPVDKDAVLARFKAGQLKLLVSTTVVEVGVDVPQATVMVVEHAQRFGFAQLHQLRGRVGRSSRQSYCYLVYDGGDGVQQKMKVLERHSNGFVVAECDLELRGSGELLGTRQSGRGLRTSFKAATIPGDRALLDEARRAASRLLAQQPDPRQWRPELVGLVASDSLLELDTVTLPSLG